MKPIIHAVPVDTGELFVPDSLQSSDSVIYFATDKHIYQLHWQGSEAGNLLTLDMDGNGMVIAIVAATDAVYSVNY